tara:strand:+ start:4033 stop:4413 length:381 start_codon:yes stop_codon:yes gene_type:complete
MISSVSFHPFISHFPPALFVAGLTLLFLAKNKKDPKLNSAASFNLSLGLLAAVVSSFSGMMSVDLNLLATVDVEGHQGYSFLFTVLYGFVVGYSYTNSFSKTAQGFYIVGLVTMCLCLFTGYQLVF